MTELATRYLGLDLRSPIVASASPLTGELDALVDLERAGVGAVVLPSLVEEQLVHDSLSLDHLLSVGQAGAETDGYFPELDDYNSGPDHYLNLVEQAKAALDVPVIASLNGVTFGGLIHYARLVQTAGADAVELNLYFVAADPERAAADIEQQYVDLVTGVRAALDVPFAVKIGPAFTSLAHTAAALVDAGADGLVLFNRFYQPDIDLDTLEVVPRLVLSTPDELRLPLRWIAILHRRLAASLACTTGVHTAGDVAKVLLAGGDVAMMASALLQRGPSYVAEVEAGLRAWMADHDYASVDQLRGSLAQQAVPDPEAYERANYMRTILSYGAPRRS